MPELRAVTVSTFAEKMAAAKGRKAERTVPICLAGDLVAQLEQLEADAAAARIAAKTTASKEDAGGGAIVEKILALQAEMRESTETFRLRAIAPRRYQALREAHPPRRNEAGELDALDGRLGFNRATMLPELVQLCTVSPELDAAGWRELFGDTEEEASRLEADGRADEVVEGLLTYGQMADLQNAAYALNELEIDVPFSPAVSLMNRASDGE